MLFEGLRFQGWRCWGGIGALLRLRVGFDHSSSLDLKVYVTYTMVADVTRRA